MELLPSLLSFGELVEEMVQLAGNISVDAVRVFRSHDSRRKADDF